MNTKAFEQFDVINEVDLSAVEGGYSAGACLTDIGLGMVGGGAAGVAGGVAGIALGVALGQIGGNVRCITSYVGGKQNGRL